MIDCPCGFGKNIGEDQSNCPFCGTDLKPLHRLRGLPRRLQDEGLRLLAAGDAAAAAEKLSAAVSLDPGLGEARRALEGISSPLRAARNGRKAKGLALAAALAGFVLGGAVFLLLRPEEKKPERPAGDVLASLVQAAFSGQPALSACLPRIEATPSGLSLAGEVPSDLHRDFLLILALRAAEGADVDARDLRVVPPAERPAPEDVLFYTVQAGDSLGAIAGRFLGRPGLWPRIFEANRGALESAHDISPGQVLAIPIYGSRLAAAPPKKHSE